MFWKDATKESPEEDGEYYTSEINKHGIQINKVNYWNAGASQFLLSSNYVQFWGHIPSAKVEI